MKRMRLTLPGDEKTAKLGMKCLLIIVLFLLALGGLVYPVYSRVQTLDERLEAMQSKLTEQDVYLPYYAKLQALHSKTPDLNLSLGKKRPLVRQNAFGVVEDLERMAHAVGMNTLDIGVDQGALRAGLETTVLTGVFSGDKKNFHELYVAVNTLPYVDKVRKVELRAVPDGVEVFLELAVLIQKNQGRNR